MGKSIKHYALNILSVFSLLYAVNVMAEATESNVKEKIETLPSQCDLYMEIPIGIHIDEAQALLGQPMEVNDISIEVFTWRIGDSFMTLQYDRGQLTTVEIDQSCDDPKYRGTEACEYFFKFRKNWPEYDAIEYQLGKPIEMKKIPRNEWVWKNKTEKVYIEVKEDLVNHIECIPTKIKYIYENEETSETESQSGDEQFEDYEADY